MHKFVFFSESNEMYNCWSTLTLNRVREKKWVKMNILGNCTDGGVMFTSIKTATGMVLTRQDCAFPILYTEMFLLFFFLSSFFCFVWIICFFSFFSFFVLFFPFVMFCYFLYIFFFLSLWVGGIAQIKGAARRSAQGGTFRPAMSKCRVHYLRWRIFSYFQ